MHMQFTFKRLSETYVHFTLKTGSQILQSGEFCPKFTQQLTTLQDIDWSEKLELDFACSWLCSCCLTLGKEPLNRPPAKRKHDYTPTSLGYSELSCFEVLREALGSATEWTGLSIIISKTQAAEAQRNPPSLLAGHVLSRVAF